MYLLVTLIFSTFHNKNICMTNKHIIIMLNMLSSLEKAYSECREKLETILKEAIRTKAESDSTLK